MSAAPIALVACGVLRLGSCLALLHRAPRVGAAAELMPLMRCAVILVARSDRLARRAAFVYLAVPHLGGGGVWIALLTLSQLGAMAGHGALLTIAPAGQLAILAAALIGFGTKA